eukprot:TRINITY_DN15114_c0_g1_i2.p1 TRINITY_DN15114_c0_g1~~TRINITY_DN15114_c0_g1_i2.p1  ORF type:complete len:262 (+),score=44.03 TRINITY_DN15114_c0_g1_i2:80-787(+)
MFHVSTMLPYQAHDLQRIERKRHLGNDVVLIIFCDGGTFDPRQIKSHFNHNFVVVRVESENTYRVSIANKNGVPPYPPFLSDPPIIKSDAKGRQFFLTKLINAERSSMLSEDFVGRIVRGRRSTLMNLAETLLTHSGKPMSPSPTPRRRENQQEPIRKVFDGLVTLINHQTFDDIAFHDKLQQLATYPCTKDTSDAIRKVQQIGKKILSQTTKNPEDLGEMNQIIVQLIKSMSFQ